MNNEYKEGFASEGELDKLVARTTRKRMILKGKFPAPRQVTTGRVGTPWFEVRKWMQELPPSSMVSPNPAWRKEA